MNNYTNFTNSFTHSLLYLPNRESTVKRKINLSIPFVHDPPFCTPTRLAEKSRTSPVWLTLSQYRLLEIFEGKGKGLKQAYRRRRAELLLLY